MMVRAILAKRGHSVVLAGNGREAIEIWRSEKSDAILMDVQMPEMDGFEATAVPRQEEAGSGRHQTIIAITAHAMEGDDARCLQAGMEPTPPNPYGRANCSLRLRPLRPGRARQRLLPRFWRWRNRPAPGGNRLDAVPVNR